VIRSPSTPSHVCPFLFFPRFFPCNQSLLPSSSGFWGCQRKVFSDNSMIDHLSVSRISSRTRGNGLTRGPFNSIPMCLGWSRSYSLATGPRHTLASPGPCEKKTRGLFEHGQLPRSRTLYVAAALCIFWSFLLKFIVSDQLSFPNSNSSAEHHVSPEQTAVGSWHKHHTIDHSRLAR
jgi:hypothetical protein